MAYKPEYKLCPDPEHCDELHNEVFDSDDTPHHYGCECDGCMRFYWLLKHGR